ncbi:MAG: hypothetical protein R3B36_04445 [Polyangiaceae bacterium]
MKDLRWLGLSATLGAAALMACTSASNEAASDADLRPAERKIVGEAREYPADVELSKRLPELNRSMKERRAAAWKAIARALAAVPLADKAVQVDGTEPTLPLFRTWYGKDDLERLFGKMYADMTPAERRARRAFTPDEIRAAFRAHATDQGSWSEDEYLARVKRLADKPGVDGLGGNSRVSYSPGFVRHLLMNYAPATACLPKLGTFTPDVEHEPDNFSQCYSAEFPVDAALVKASWWRADFGMSLPVYDTSAATLRAKLSGESDQGGWGKGQDKATPDATQIYTVKTSDGATFRMPGMHLATKELREWLWITMWWSPDADSDFGQDRPDEIRALGGPWSSYKMCVVTAYEEADPDPTGGFGGSLGEALAATHAGKGPTWCSNPYVEKGAKNAQTNCIGCHQHAGIPGLGSEAILADDAAFPSAGRTKLRKSFPTDYTWAFDAPPESLARILESHVQHHDTTDP